MRGKTPAARTVMVGSVEAAQAAQVASLKEDLYSDLTGLILRSVERGDDFDVYDCLQTGPNGSKSIFSISKIASDSNAVASSPSLQTRRLQRHRRRLRQYRVSI